VPRRTFANRDPILRILLCTDAERDRDIDCGLSAVFAFANEDRFVHGSRGRQRLLLVGIAVGFAGTVATGRNGNVVSRTQLSEAAIREAESLCDFRDWFCPNVVVELLASEIQIDLQTTEGALNL